MKMVKLYRSYRYFGRTSPKFKSSYKSFWQFLNKVVWSRNMVFQTYRTKDNLGLEECGYSIIRLNRKDNEVILEDFFVSKPFRRRGHATAAIQSLLKTYETEKYLKFTVILRGKDTLARHLFVNRLNFVEDPPRTLKLLLDRGEKDKGPINRDDLETCYYTPLG